MISNTIDLDDYIRKSFKSNYKKKPRLRKLGIHWICFIPKTPHTDIGFDYQPTSFFVGRIGIGLTIEIAYNNWTVMNEISSKEFTVTK